MNCKDVRDLLAGPIGPTTQQLEALASHLNTCLTCQAHVDEDPFAGRPEWRQAFLEVFESKTKEEFQGGSDTFARKMFDRVWPHVRHAQERKEK